MQAKTNQCQNCKKDFVIEPDDFKFYEKMKVPAPMWCPECRLQRRLSFLNHQTLYKRKCDMCAQSLISVYPQSAPFPVYCPDCYWADKWDAKSYGRDYDFSKPFFEQIKELSLSVPHVSLMGLHTTWINSEYNNFASELKNCYLLFNSDYNENCSYGSEIENSKECYDNTMINSCQLCYKNVNLNNCYNARFSIDCDNCQNILFCKNCIGCDNCVGCINLKNKKNYIFNMAYTKEGYEAKIKEFNLGSIKELEKLKKKSKDLWLQHSNKFIHGRQNINVSGDYINNSKNVKNSYIALGSQDCRYCMWLLVKPNKDCYDYTQFGDNAEKIYDTLVCGRNISNIKFSSCCVDSVSFVEYSDYCNSANHLFGCSFMQRGNFYCILNKQYTKEEYEALVPKIIQHMKDMPYTDKKGRVYKYGEFFPTELSPFAYNETIAQEYFPLTKEQAMEQGCSWKDPEERNYKIDINSQDLPDHIKDVKDDIVGKVIECSHKGECNHQCKRAFKIIPQELQFYQKMNLPLPRLCPNCRRYERLSQRNPLKLWHRKCMKEGCANEFETSYAPDRPEIVYCEQCYQQEVA